MTRLIAGFVDGQIENTRPYTTMRIMLDPDVAFAMIKRIHDIEDPKYCLFTLPERGKSHHTGGASVENVRFQIALIAASSCRRGSSDIHQFTEMMKLDQRVRITVAPQKGQKKGIAWIETIPSYNALVSIRDIDENDLMNITQSALGIAPKRTMGHLPRFDAKEVFDRTKNLGLSTLAGKLGALAYIGLKKFPETAEIAFERVSEKHEILKEAA